MKRFTLSLLLLVLSFSFVNAQKYLTRTGHIWFYSHTPVEDIEAHNHQSMSVLNLENGEIAFQVLMKSFQFEKALMQEHFNEKYVDSDRYPKATFQGKIEDFESLDLTADGEYEVTVTGDLTIHGITQSVTTKGTLKVSGGDIGAISTFVVKPADYHISIPSIVRDKIAEEIEVTVDLTYQMI